jgi:hypothetical protein
MRRSAFLWLVLLVGCDTAPAIHGTTQLQDTQNRLGPYVVVTEADDPDGLDGVELRYKAGATSEVAVEMSEIEKGVWEGEIPGQPPLTAVAYYVVASDGDERVSDPPGALTASSKRFRFKVLSQKCVVDLDCGPGEICDASKLCRQHLGPCTGDRDCGNGRRCAADGSCRLAARSCLLDEGCLPGEVCDAILEECAPRPLCDLGLACPLDFVCDETFKICRRACMGNADCGPGEYCQTGGKCSGARVCKDTSDCDKDLVCDTVGGYCRPAGAALCAPCIRDADCGGPTDFCLLLSTGQFCGQDCSSKSCPQGYGCNKNTDPPQCVPDSGSCG